MPCHCMSVVILTRSTEAQKNNISSLWKWEMGPWSDIVVYTHQPHELPIAQTLEQFLVYPVWERSCNFRCSSGVTQTGPACTTRMLGAARMQHVEQGWGTATRWHLIHCCPLQPEQQEERWSQVPPNRISTTRFSIWQQVKSFSSDQVLPSSSRLWSQTVPPALLLLNIVVGNLMDSFIWNGFTICVWFYTQTTIS